MSHGPLSTVFLVTAELFPTKWRATGKRKESRGEQRKGVTGVEREKRRGED